MQDCISDLENLQSVWGHGFPTALISVKNLGINRPQIQVLGSKSDTVKIISNGVAFLFFRRSMKEVQELTEHNRALFNIVGTPNMNEFRGRYTPQITVKDYTIQPSDFNDLYN